MATNDIILLVIILICTLLGFVRGFVKSVSKLFCVAASGVAAFTLGGLINKLLVTNIQALQDFVNQNGFFAFLVVAGSYAVTFFVVFIILKLIFKLLDNLIEATEAGKVINKILGVLVGFAIGVIVCDGYVWVTYGISYISQNLRDWIIADTQLNVANHVPTLYELLLNLNMGAIGKTVAQFPGL